MSDPLNDPLRIWVVSKMPPHTPAVQKYAAGQIVIESEVYAKRVAAEFMMSLATGLAFSGASFHSHQKTFLIEWERPLPKETKNNIGKVFNHLRDIFGSYQAKIYGTLIPKLP